MNLRSILLTAAVVATSLWSMTVTAETTKPGDQTGAQKGGAKSSPVGSAPAQPPAIQKKQDDKPSPVFIDNCPAVKGCAPKAQGAGK